jgi:type IV pilus assembly protein PilW
MSNEGGFTLLELMIALSLGLLVAAAIGSIYIGSNQTYRVQEDSARIQEIGRYALEVLGRSLRQAGYADLPVTPTSTKTTFTGTPINGTNGAAGAPDAVTIQYDGTGQAD